MRKRLKKLILGAVLAICAGGPGFAQSAQEALEDLLRQGASAEAFSPSFLARISPEQVQGILEQLGALIGMPNTIEVRGGEFFIETASHQVSGTISLDESGRIAGLFFQTPEPKPKDLEAALATLSGIAPVVSWLVLRDGVEIAAKDADQPLSVASAFKLGVLAVLNQDIIQGTHAWDEVVNLEARHKSLPTGQLQTMPDGAPLTLHTVAALMISISDNTATDLLIDLLGRERVAAGLGLKSLLTTREFFALRLDSEALALWSAAKQKDRPEIAAQAAQNLPELGTLPDREPDLAWDVPLTRLCALIGPLADLPLMQVNPGLAAPKDWARVAYKGGSEPGVLNFTTALLDDEGREYCVAATFNASEPLDELAAAAAYRGLLAVLR